MRSLYDPTIYSLALGGGVGAVCRFLISLWCERAFGTGFPVGTLLVNVLGSLLMGLLMGWLTDAAPPQAAVWQSMLGSGFLGALTTFSTFSLDLFKMLHAGEPRKAVVYLLLQLSLCTAGAAMGLLLASF